MITLEDGSEVFATQPGCLEHGFFEATRRREAAWEEERFRRMQREAVGVDRESGPDPRMAEGDNLVRVLLESGNSRTYQDLADLIKSVCPDWDRSV
jgi:hypothetical protein